MTSDRVRKPVYIEFVGASGAGKSTLCLSIADYLTRANREVHVLRLEFQTQNPKSNRLLKWMKVVIAAFIHFKSTLRVTKFLASCQLGPKNFFEMIASWLMVLYYASLGHTNPGFNLSDHGIFQNLCTLLIRSPKISLEAFVNISRELPLPDIVIIVNVQNTSANQRLQTRRKILMAQGHPGLTHRVVDPTTFTKVKSLITELSCNTKLICINVDNELGMLESNVESIIRYIDAVDNP